MAFNYEFPYTDPNLYNDDWLLKRMKELLVQLTDLENWRQEWQDEYDAFKALVEQIEAGVFPESIRQAFQSWMERNALSLVGELVNMVIFNITDDGYFVAYIPGSWDEIQFATTGLDVILPEQPEYGHLVLSYNASTNAY